MIFLAFKILKVVTTSVRYETPTGPNNEQKLLLKRVRFSVVLTRSSFFLVVKV